MANTVLLHVWWEETLRKWKTENEEKEAIIFFWRGKNEEENCSLILVGFFLFDKQQLKQLTVVLEETADSIYHFFHFFFLFCFCSIQIRFCWFIYSFYNYLNDKKKTFLSYLLLLIFFFHSVIPRCCSCCKCLLKSRRKTWCSRRRQQKHKQMAL